VVAAVFGLPLNACSLPPALRHESFESSLHRFPHDDLPVFALGSHRGFVVLNRFSVSPRGNQSATFCTAIQAGFAVKKICPVNHHLSRRGAAESRVSAWLHLGEPSLFCTLIVQSRAAFRAYDMKPLALVVLSALGAVLAGCDSTQPQPERPAAKPPYQRFVPVQALPYVVEGVPWHGYFALDTKTGTLCSTVKDRAFKGVSEWANDVPPCSQVLATNPDN
jgi:hypothetical protein